MVNILISGYYGFDNIGDESILRTLVSSLREHIPDCSLTVLSHNPASTREKYGVEAVDRMSPMAILRAVKKCDMLISGGGSLLQDVTSSKSLHYYLSIIRCAEFFHKKVFIYSQGIGPIDRPGNRRHPQTVRLRLPATIRITTANITIISDFPTSLHVGLDVEPQRTLAAGKIDAQYLEKPAPLAARIETHGHTQRISGHNRLSVIFQRGTSARRFAPDDYERLPAPIAETRFEPRRFAAVETSETQGIRHVRMQRFGRNCDNGARKCPMPAARAAAAKQHEHHADGRAASPKSTPQPPHG